MAHVLIGEPVSTSPGHALAQEAHHGEPFRTGRRSSDRRDHVDADPEIRRPGRHHSLSQDRRARSHARRPHQRGDASGRRGGRRYPARQLQEIPIGGIERDNSWKKEWGELWRYEEEEGTLRPKGTQPDQASAAVPRRSVRSPAPEQPGDRWSIRKYK